MSSISILPFVLAASTTLAIIAFAVMPPALGYELTPYSPLFPWWVTAFNYACLAAIIAHPNSTRLGRWAGAVAIFLNNAAVLLVPLFKGYWFYPEGDAQTHLGYARGIVETGGIGTLNIYPIVHTLAATYHLTLGLELATIALIVPLMWYGFLVAGQLLWLHALRAKSEFRWAGVALSLGFVFASYHTVIHPSMFSLFMVPWVGYLICRRERAPSYAILAATFVAAILYAHPVTGIFATLLLLTSEVFSNALAKGPASPRRPYTLTLLALVIFVSWYWTFRHVLLHIQTAIESVLFQSEDSLFEEHTKLAESIPLSAQDLSTLLVTRYGLAIISASLVCLAIVGTPWRRNRERSELVVAAMACIGVLLSATSFFVFTHEREFGLRVLRFMIIFSPLSLVIVLDRWRGKPRGHRAVMFAVVLIVGLLGIGTIFNSPLNAKTNWQVTATEGSGVYWLWQNGDRGVETIHVGTNITRVEHQLFGVSRVEQETIPVSNRRVPSEFNYRDDGLVSWASGTHYLAVAASVRVDHLTVPSSVRHLATTYSTAAFGQLNNEPSGNQIYSTNSLDIWLLKSS